MIESSSLLARIKQGGFINSHRWIEYSISSSFRPPLPSYLLGGIVFHQHLLQSRPVVTNVYICSAIVSMCVCLLGITNVYICSAIVSMCLSVCLCVCERERQRERERERERLISPQLLFTEVLAWPVVLTMCVRERERETYFASTTFYWSFGVTSGVDFWRTEEALDFLQFALEIEGNSNIQSKDTCVEEISHFKPLLAHCRWES